MAKQNALSYLSTTLTQGSADAFVQASIQTALSGLTKTCYRLRTLELEFTGQQGIAMVSNEVSMALTRKSFAAMPTNLEKSLILKWKRGLGFTTSGGLVSDGVIRLTFPEDEAPVIVEDPLYAQLDSTSTGLTLVTYMRLGYTVEAISEIDRLTLVSNSLA